MAKNGSSRKQAERRKKREARAKQALAAQPAFNQADYEECIRASRPDYLLEIQSLIEEAAEIVRSHDSLHLLGVVAATNLFVNPETYTESTHDGKEANVEYALSLVTSLDNTRSEGKADGACLERFDHLIREILLQTTFYYGSESVERKQSTEAYSLRYGAILRRLHLRGDSVIEHHRDMVLGLLQPHDAFLSNRFGFTTADILMAQDEMGEQIQANLHSQEPLFARLRTPFLAFQEFAEAENPELVGMQEQEELSDADRARFQEELEALRVKFDASESGRIMREDYEAATKEEAASNLWASIFEVRPNDSALTPQFLDAFSQALGDNMEFRENPRSPYGPLNPSSIYTKPLVKREGVYYNFCPPLFFRGIVNIVDDLIHSADPEYFERYAKARGEYLEEQVVQHFSQLLPGAQIYTNLFFPFYENGMQKHPETDCLVIYDNNLIIVESKAGVLSPSARRGSVDRIKADVDSLIDAAYKQAMRVKAYVQSSPFPIFEDENHSPVLCVDMSEIKNIYLVNATLDNLGHLAIDLSDLRGLKRLKGNSWIWSVYINDLRTIAEISDGPSEFLLYLDRRLDANNYPQFNAFDELDYFMFFLDTGLYFEGGMLKPYDSVQPSGFTEPLDRYYDFLAGRVSSGAKPQLGIPEESRQLIREIERMGCLGSTDFTRLILGLSAQAQGELLRGISSSVERYKRDGKIHNLSMPMRETPQGITVYVSRDPDQLAKLDTGEYVSKLMYNSKAERWFQLSIFMDPEVRMTLSIIERKWKYDSRMAAAARELPSFKYRDQIQGRKGYFGKYGRRS